MKDEDLEKLFWEAVKTAEAHRISLGFNCGRCGGSVYKTFAPANETIPFAQYLIGCGCRMHSYTEDREITKDDWDEIISGLT